MPFRDRNSLLLYCFMVLSICIGVIFIVLLLAGAFSETKRRLIEEQVAIETDYAQTSHQITRSQ